MRRKRRKPAKRVFVSHSANDRKFVFKLTKFLREESVAYWYSSHHIAGANEWHDEIGKGLRKCHWFVLILSPNSVKSTWVKRELLFALQEKRYDGRIVPVLLKKCSYARLSWTLSSFQFVFFHKDFATGCRQLLKAIGKGR